MKTPDGSNPPRLYARVGTDSLSALSIHHRNAPLVLLERMALSPAALATLHEQFARSGLQAVVLSTCNRTELYVHSLRPGDHARAEALLMAATLGEDAVCETLTRLSGRDAAQHLFRVASGLESLVLGEAEILGQIRGSLDIARTAGAAGSFLARLFQAALRAGGRARSETGIGTGALSVASAAVRLLASLQDDLPHATVVVVGTGVTGLKAARHLKAEGVGRLVLINRTRERAERAATELGAEGASLADLTHWLGRADAVVIAAQVEQPLLTRAHIVGGRGASPGTRLVLIDLSLPRAIDPACGEAANVALHNLTDLEQIVAENRERRETEIPAVETLLEHELSVFAAWAREDAARPLIAEIRRRAELIRREEIEQALSSGPLELGMIEHLTRRIVDRLMQYPIHALQGRAEGGPSVIADLEKAWGSDDGVTDASC